MHPLDSNWVHYGDPDRELWDLDKFQPELFPDKVRQLRLKLYQKAKHEPSFRFYALYDRVYRMDVLKAAWKQVGKRRKAAGIDGVRAEMILDQEQGVDEFLVNIQDELKQKCYCPSPVKRVYIPKADGKKRPLGIPTLAAYCTSYNSVLERHTDFTAILDELQTHSNNSFSLPASSLIQ